jgi:cytochrome c2
LVGLVGSLVALVRTKSPWAAAGALVAALIGVYGFALVVPQTAASEPKIVVAPVVSVEQGQRLFIAKGCVVCHTHDAVAEAKKVIGFNDEAAPNLTNFTAEPEYLAKWLDDPTAIKPDTSMPNLNLSDDETGALVLFLNAP